MSWQEKVKVKRRQQQDQIPKEWQLSQPTLDRINGNQSTRLIKEEAVKLSGILSADELAITENWTASQLLNQLASGQVSSLALTTAICKRAAVAQQLTSCLTEIFFTDALERAKYLDQYLQDHGKPLGPLHGLPISIKESFSVKGQKSTSGWVSWLDDESETSNSALVDILLNLGAVLYCKTNVPQTYMSADSENNVFGRTLNPHNTALTAGGSSGGEGALIALRGSPLGVGTDIAGSIRIPALCCGIYGFKPSSDRVPHSGQKFGDELQGLPGIRACSGPLGCSLDDIEIFMQSVLGASPDDYDTTAHAVPWRRVPETTPREQLRIGVLGQDPNYPLHPPVRRTLDRAVNSLKQAGHSIVHLSPEQCQTSHASRIASQYFTTGPAQSGEDHFHGPNAEPPVKSIAQAAHPFWTGPPPVDTRLDAYFKFSELHKIRQKLQDDWRQMWIDCKIDCVIGPGAQNTAVAHDTYAWPPYTVLYNLLDYPACIIPFGNASKAEDPEVVTVPGPYQPAYHPEEVDGAPCAIQVATRRFQDEKCIHVAKIIDQVLKNQ